MPIIPPLIEDTIFVLDFTGKAEIFTDYVKQQCITMDTAHKLPPTSVPNTSLLTRFSISDKILTIIQSLNHTRRMAEMISQYK